MVVAYAASLSTHPCNDVKGYEITNLEEARKYGHFSIHP
jgi:hypothetical protein